MRSLEQAARALDALADSLAARNDYTPGSAAHDALKNAERDLRAYIAANPTPAPLGEPEWPDPLKAMNEAMAFKIDDPLRTLTSAQTDSLVKVVARAVEIQQRNDKEAHRAGRTA